MFIPNTYTVAVAVQCGMIEDRLLFLEVSMDKGMHLNLSLLWLFVEIVSCNIGDADSNKKG